MPTVGILNQTRRWYQQSQQTITLALTLFENYFFPAIQSDPLSTATVVLTSGSQSGSFSPTSLGRVISTFGVSSSNSSDITGAFSGTQGFLQPGIPKSKFATADGWGDLGQRLMPSQLLVAPSAGFPGNRSCYIVAGGDITVPSPSSKALWSMIVKLGLGGTLYECLIADTILNRKSVSTLYSFRNTPKEPPKLQLSLGASYQGATFGTPKIRLMQFEIQEA